MGPIGVPEMFAIFVVALILFGPKKLPELGRTLGKAMHEFRKAKNELKNTFESHMREIDRETRMLSTTDTSSTPSYMSGPKSSGYSYPYEDYQYDSTSHPSLEGSNAPYASTPAEAEPSVSALPAGAEATHNEHASAVHSESLPSWPPVAGAVPRTNGVRPAAESARVDEEAPVREEHSV